MLAKAIKNRNLKFLLIIGLLLATTVYASVIDKSSVQMTYHIDSGVRRDTINKTDIGLKYNVRAGTQPQIINKSDTILDLMQTVLPPYITDTRNLFNFSSLKTEIVWAALSLVLNNSNGTVDFETIIDLSNVPVLDLDKNVNISYNHIEINGTVLPQLNKPSKLTLTNLTFSNIRILKDGTDCIDCTIISYSSSNLIFNAPGFTVYQAINGSAYPAIKVSTKVNVTNATLNVTGDIFNGSYPANVSIDIGNDGIVEWNFTSALNATEQQFTNLTRSLNSLLRDCNCPGCVLSGLACIIDIAINSETQGTVELSDLNISQVIRNVTWGINDNLTLIDLDDYFYDANGDILNYTSEGTYNVTVYIDNSTGIVTLIPLIGWSGTTYAVFTANDTLNITRSNNITLIVIDDKEPKWQQNSTNLTSTSDTNNVVQFNINWTDEVELSYIIFSWNDTGVWQNISNISARSLTSLNYSVNVTITANTNTFVHYKFFANDSSNNWNQTNEWYFQVYNILPDLLNVSISDTTGGYSDCTYAACTLTPVAGTNISLAVKVVVNDTDNNCDTNGGKAWIHLCLNNSNYQNCDESAYNYTWMLDKVTRDGSICTYEFNKNLTAANGTPEFFRLAGDYLYHINVTDEIGERTSDSEMNGTWTYNSLTAASFPSNITLGDDTIELGTWNYGTRQYNLTNYGNKVFDLQWNATNPNAGIDTWQLNGTDFYLDDDGSLTDSPEYNLTSIVMNGTPLYYFNYSTGIQVCTNYLCDNPLINETLATYWHIAPPVGLLAGTYNTTITYIFTQR